MCSSDLPAAKGSERLLLPDDLAPFTAFSVPSNPQYALVSSLDTMSAARRDFGSMVDDVSRYSSAVSDRALTSRGGMADLPCHAILDRGRLIGFWEYDVEKQSIVSALFGGSRDHALSAAIHETESYVREQLGDARSFSLDSPASRAPKIEALRRM